VTVRPAPDPIRLSGARVRRYHLRGGSGGAGRCRGGDGIVRELELGCEADVTLLGDRIVIEAPGGGG